MILVRHGRTEANAGGLLQGRIDLPLDDVGREQGRRVSAAVGRPDVLISSPLLALYPLLTFHLRFDGVGTHRRVSPTLLVLRCSK